MKKTITLLLIAIMTVCALSGCGKTKGSDATNGKIKVVTTIFPQYDWVKQILGDKSDKVDLTLLINKGVDLHSYQPSTSDIAKISEADLFIYVGGESDEWVDAVLKQTKNKNLKVINLMDILGDNVVEEELKEGMQESKHHHDEDEKHDDAKHEDKHDDHDDHDDAKHEDKHDDHDDAKHEDKHDDHDSDDDKHHHHDGEKPENDEHVWLSLRNAKLICGKIEEALSEIDKDNAETYKKNYENYAKKLDELDGKYKSTIESSKYKTVIFGDRFPFRYLVKDYNLDYFAAFVGCSAESEASFDTITFLANKTDALGINNILTIEGAKHKIADTIVENTKNKNQKVLTMDSMQSTTSKDIESGTSYLGIMEKNLEVLKQALN